MGPEGPWQQLRCCGCNSVYMFLPYYIPVQNSSAKPLRSRTAPYLHGGLPFLLPYRRRKMTEGNVYRTKGRQGKSTFSRWAGPALLSFLLPFSPLLLLRGRQVDHPPGPSLPKEGWDRGGCSVVPGERPGGRRPQVLPPTCLPDTLPYRSALGLPGLASDDEVAGGLPLSAVAPPALVRLNLSNLVGRAGPSCGVA